MNVRVTLVLWLLNAVLFVLIVYLTYSTVSARNVRNRDSYDALMRSIADSVESRPKCSEIRAAWEDILVISSRLPLADARQDIAMLLILVDTPQAQINPLQDISRRYVNTINISLAASVDEGLLSMKMFAKRYPGLCFDLLNELPLIIPVIWYESLISARGRWGFRLLTIYEILDKLRAISTWESVREASSVSIGNYTFCLRPRISSLSEKIAKIKYLIVPLSISRGSKCAQDKTAKQMRQRLRGVGVNTPDLNSVFPTKCW